MGGCPCKDCKNRKYHRRTEYLDTESSFHLYPVLLCNFLKYILGYKSEMGGSSCQAFKFTVELRLRVITRNEEVGRISCCLWLHIRECMKEYAFGTDNVLGTVPVEERRRLLRDA